MRKQPRHHSVSNPAAAFGSLGGSWCQGTGVLWQAALHLSEQLAIDKYFEKGQITSCIDVLHEMQGLNSRAGRRGVRPRRRQPPQAPGKSPHLAQLVTLRTLRRFRQPCRLCCRCFWDSCAAASAIKTRIAHPLAPASSRPSGAVAGTGGTCRVVRGRPWFQLDPLNHQPMTRSAPPPSPAGSACFPPASAGRGEAGCVRAAHGAGPAPAALRGGGGAAVAHGGWATCLGSANPFAWPLAAFTAFWTYQRNIN